MYFDINLKLLSGKNTQKVKNPKYSGWVKFGVRWAERDNLVEKIEDSYWENSWKHVVNSIIVEF